MKKIIAVAFFLLLTACILTHSAWSLAYAALGLQLWYERMVPVLLPFMILSGTLIRMGLVTVLLRPVRPLFEKALGLSEQAVYVILMGFLCGFPMGAKTIADFRLREELSVSEGQYLLAFCNNLGPVYFVGFVLPLLHKSLLLPYLTGMYGIPLLYGFFLRHTVCRKQLRRCHTTFRSAVHCPNAMPFSTASVYTSQNSTVSPGMPLPDALDDAVNAAGRNILQLGGYMIFFNLLNLLPRLFLPDAYRYAPLLEISGGLKLLGDRYPLYALLLLPAGGLCCIAQTGSCIRNTGLSLKKYILDKLILTMLTAIYYFGWSLLAPNTFLL